MCDLIGKNRGQEIESKKHLKILSRSDIYGVCLGDEGCLYLAKLDRSLNPIQLWSGSEEDINKVYLAYCKHEKIEFDLLELRQVNDFTVVF